LILTGFVGWAKPAGSVLYAKPSASGAGDCSSWADACPLRVAIVQAATGDEIWVTEGTHKPTTSTDRGATFQLKSGVGVYGGFVGTETSREQRNWVAHVTILSGDIGTQNYPWDNSFHVVTASGTDTNTRLDGFTITGGCANVSPDYSGGGMSNYNNSNPTLTNVTFSGNDAYGGGGGMSNSSNSSPTLTNVTFAGNSAYGGSGGGIYDDGSSLMLTDVTFSGNSAATYGGGMYNGSYASSTLTGVSFNGNSAGYGGGMYNGSYASATLTNVTFSGNSATALGGGMYNDGSSPTLTNVAFSNNSATAYGGGGIYNNNSNPQLTGVTFSGNSASSDGGGIYNDGSSPTLTDVIFSGNSATDGGGGMYNVNLSSPTLTNVTYSFNSAWHGGGMYNDQSDATLINVTFNGNYVAVSGGAMYNQNYSTLAMANCILWGNTPNQIYNVNSMPTFAYSDVQHSGGSDDWDSSLGYDLGHNLDADPMYADPDGPDNIPGTPDDDLRLLSGSPSIDAGNNSYNSTDTDLAGQPRISDGDGDRQAIIDMGAYEAPTHYHWWLFLPLVLRYSP